MEANTDSTANTGPDLYATIKLLDAIHEAEGRMIDADQALCNSVKRARRAKVTWAEIGHTLGMTRQGAQQRFGMYEHKHAKAN